MEKGKKLIFLCFVFPNQYGKLSQGPRGLFTELCERTVEMNRMHYFPQVTLLPYEDGSFELAHNHGVVCKHHTFFL